MTRRKLLQFLAYGDMPRFGVFPVSYERFVKQRVFDEHEQRQAAREKYVL